MSFHAQSDDYHGDYGDRVSDRVNGSDHVSESDRDRVNGSDHVSESDRDRVNGRDVDLSTNSSKSRNVGSTYLRAETQIYR